MGQYAKITLNKYQTILGEGVCKVCGGRGVVVRTQTKTYWSEYLKCLKGHHIEIAKGLYEIFKIGNRFKYYIHASSTPRGVPVDRASYKELTVIDIQPGILEYELIVHCDRIFIQGVEIPHSWCVGTEWKTSGHLDSMELITDEGVGNDQHSDCDSARGEPVTE